MNLSHQNGLPERTGHEANEGEIIVYQPNSTLRLEVKIDGSTAWLNRQQMAVLFGRDIKTIGKHIANALREELNPAFSNVGSFPPDANDIRHRMMAAENPVVAKFATTAADGDVYQGDDAEWHVCASLKDAGSALFVIMKMELDRHLILSLMEKQGVNMNLWVTWMGTEHGKRGIRSVWNNSRFRLVCFLRWSRLARQLKVVKKKRLETLVSKGKIALWCWNVAS